MNRSARSSIGWERGQKVLSEEGSDDVVHGEGGAVGQHEPNERLDSRLKCTPSVRQVVF